MKLHQDREAFGDLLSDISRRTGIRSDIIEKDYYLTLLLWELAEKQGTLPAYFKGGTALYKAIGRMKRFSEKSKSLYFSDNPNQNKIQTYA